MNITYKEINTFTQLNISFSQSLFRKTTPEAVFFLSFFFFFILKAIWHVLLFWSENKPGSQWSSLDKKSRKMVEQPVNKREKCVSLCHYLIWEMHFLFHLFFKIFIFTLICSVLSWFSLMIIFRVEVHVFNCEKLEFLQWSIKIFCLDSRCFMPIRGKMIFAILFMNICNNYSLVYQL